MTLVVGTLAKEFVRRSDEARQRAATAEDWAEVRRLEEIAVRICRLETLGEELLSSVNPSEAQSDFASDVA